MRLPSLAFAALLAAPMLRAEPVRLDRLPQSAGGFLHLDMDAARNSSLAEPIHDLLASQTRAAGAGVTGMAGFDFSRDASGVTIALWQAKEGAPLPPYACIISAKYDAAKFGDALAGKPGAVAGETDGFKWWRVGQSCICPTPDSLIIAPDAVTMALALKRAGYKADSFASEAAAAAPIFCACFGEGQLAAVQHEVRGQIPLKTFAVKLMEAGGTMKVRLFGGASSEEMAQHVAQMAVGYKELARITLSKPRDGESVGARRGREALVALLASAVVDAKERLVTVEGALPSAKVAAAIDSIATQQPRAAR